MDKISISVFSPCYNEEKNIGKLITGMLDFLPKISSDFEIIIVDDGSTDSSAEVAGTFAQNHTQVRVIRHENNRGYGAALRTGLQTPQRIISFLQTAIISLILLKYQNSFPMSGVMILLPVLE
jgi:glycosyltransferase involved in cell wall biosynthesis